MAQINQIEDPTGGALAEQRDALPAGEYIAAIVKSDEKTTNAGHVAINLEFEVQDGPKQGRRFWELLNLNNPNEIAREIANRSLNSICHACGKLRSSIRDTEELHGIPMRVKLKVKSDAQYGDKNEVGGYKPLNAPAGTTPANGGPAPGAGKQRAWD